MVFGFGKKEELAPAPEQIDASAAVPPPAPEAAAAAEEPPKPPVTMKIEDEVDIDPTRLQLEEQVQDRDAMISAIEKSRQEKMNELQEIENQLADEKLTQMKEALVHEYANLIKGVAPKGGVDAQYVQKLHSQLQKAVKKMEATNDQMKDLEKQSTETVDGLTREISQLVEARCRTELELRKQMSVLQEQKRDMQLDYETRIRENLKTLQALRAKAVNQTTIEELDAELEDSEAKLEELQRIHEKQMNTIETLQAALAQEGGM